MQNFDDDPITVGLFPVRQNDRYVNEMLSGVVGTSLFGNIMIRANPLADDFTQWLLYVIAHEYHHTVWGNYWFNLHGDRVKNDLLQALVIDGEADSFALSQIPCLSPNWLFLGQEAKIDILYREKYLPYLRETEFDYPTLMFGDEMQGLCSCGGYAVGYRLV